MKQRERLGTEGMGEETNRVFLFCVIVMLMISQLFITKMDLGTDLEWVMYTKLCV